MALRYGVLIIYILSFSSFAQRQHKIDSLKKELANSKIDINKFHILNHLWSESINNNIDDALGYSEDMISLGNTLKIDTIIGFGTQRKAVTYSYLNKFDSSSVYFKKALKIYAQLKDYKNIAGIERNIGQDHNMLGRLDSAYYYYDSAEKNYVTIKDSIGIADILNSKAIVYLMKGYYNLALENALVAEKTYVNNNLPMDLNQNRLVIASVYGEMKDTINAIKYYKKTLKFFDEQNQKRQYASSLFLILSLQIPNKELQKENSAYVEELLTISHELKDQSLIDDAKEKEASLLFERRRFKEAETIYRQLIKNNLIINDSYSLAYLNKDLG
ncbi:hypothetical protein [Winogradskyella sp.]|uniref:hypothetical protein n=1 Tax=Winogradskyella sp. TaxID=1883156 RepID=UPI0026292D80|nr:hypothetical protein [Winogradskyella sp.]